jgi:chemotaxis protein MotD
MISNAVAAAVAGPASSPKGPSGHASEKAHSAFKEALDRTGNNSAQEDKQETRETGGKAHSVIADARWRGAVQKNGEDGTKTPVGEDAETAPKPSGDDTDAAAGKEPSDILHAGRVTAGDTASPDNSGDEGSEDASSRETGRDETDARDVRPDAAGVQNAGAAAVAQARPAANADTRKEGDRDNLAAAKAAGNADTAQAAAGSAGAAVAGGDEQPAIAMQAVVSEDRKKAGDGAPVVAPVAGDKARMGPVERPAGTVIPARASEPGTRGERGNADEALSRAEERMPRPVPANPTPSAETARPVTVVGAGQQPVANPETPAGRQVVAAVTRDLEDLSPSRLALTTGTSQGGTVKTMRLQLNPAELGVVHIRLQSVDGELRVTIRAESDKTAKMLSGDSDAIRSALRAVGIAAPDVSVATNRSDTAQQQAHNAPNREAPGQQFGSQENRGNTPNESRQNYRELASNDTARTPAHGNDTGDGGLRRDGRVTI